MPLVKSASFLRAIDVCWELHRAGNEVAKPIQRNVTMGVFAANLPSIISATAGRSEKTFEAILHLAANDYSQQAAMLIRSMFEDVVVTHWLLLHEDEGDHYGERFIRHQDAMELAADRVAERYGAPRRDLSKIKPNEADLEAEFGPTAERSWWGRDCNGKANRLPEMVNEVGTAQRFWGRTHGQTPILKENYDMVIKWANQFLHHTALGVTIVPVGPEYVSVVAPCPVDVIGRAYYNYAMVICAVIDASGESHRTHHFGAPSWEGWERFSKRRPRASSRLRACHSPCSTYLLVNRPHPRSLRSNVCRPGRVDRPSVLVYVMNSH
jgi:hypothetical protein